MIHFSKFIDGIEYHVNHNGAWSGEAIIAYHDAKGEWHEVKLPAELLRACGRRAAFNEVIAAVEQME